MLMGLDPLTSGIGVSNKPSEPKYPDQNSNLYFPCGIILTTYGARGLLNALEGLEESGAGASFSRDKAEASRSAAGCHVKSKTLKDHVWEHVEAEAA